MTFTAHQIKMMLAKSLKDQNVTTTKKERQSMFHKFMMTQMDRHFGWDENRVIPDISHAELYAELQD